MNFELFDIFEKDLFNETISPGAVILHGFALSQADILWSEIQNIVQLAPFRHMISPSGFTMSVAMSNCGLLGWISDKKGYRYETRDPLNGQRWPSMPDLFLHVATSAAQQAGFNSFYPNSCLINRYIPQTKLSLHQDKDENLFDEPIVSISLGIPAIFLFGGLKRNDKIQRFQLEHGDVVVWGGPSRLNYHGILPIKESYHPLLGSYRVNLTFRHVG